ncbi:cytochrome D1 domain-containing protein [Kaarinaea lacus]
MRYRITKQSRNRFFISISTMSVFFLLSVVLPAIALAKTDDDQAGNKASDNLSNRLVKRGVVIDFESLPLNGDAELVEGQAAKIRFKVSSESTGEPISGIAPGAWMDMGQVIQAQQEAQQKSCKDKIALYLKGVVGIQPMLDLNSYYILIMNTDPTISVVNPLVSMVGRTSTLTKIPLKTTGADWVRSEDFKRLYVSMPKSNQVAVVDTDSFKVITNIDAGRQPTRVALQPDGRFLWVGNDSKEYNNSGVTVIDTQTLKPLATIHTGSGHHEIAFSGDSRYAFVTNRDSGTATVIDVQTRKIVKQLTTGAVPISLAYSSMSRNIYVADGKQGAVSVIDPKKLAIVKTIKLKPGLGPLRFTQDGRWAMTVNPAENNVYVIDASVDRLVHTLEVTNQPYQVTFSRAFAYVRALGSEYVTMVNLETLGEGRKPIVQRFATGDKAPKLAGNLPLADSMVPATTEAAVFIVNPADNTTYFYMEGMNAPASNYKVFGSLARAVTVVDRSLKEVEPGVYEATVRIPTAGRYDVAFQLESPNILHCFSAEAKPNPSIKHDNNTIAIDFLDNKRRVAAGEDMTFRFALHEPGTGNLKTGLRDVSVLYYRAPGLDRMEVIAREKEAGIYEVTVPIRNAGAYYLHVAVRSAKIGYNDTPYFTFMASGNVKKNAQHNKKSSNKNAGNKLSLESISKHRVLASNEN